MKPIVKLKYITAMSGLLVLNCVQFVLSEPHISSNKAKITSVKLLHRDLGNFSFLASNRDSKGGSIAKISRVIPANRKQGLKKNSSSKSQLEDNSPAEFVQSTGRIRGGIHQTENGVIRNELITNKPASNLLNESSGSKLAKNETKPFVGTEDTLNDTLERSRLVLLTEDSWNHLSSLASDQELQDAVNNIPHEIMASVSATDPSTSQTVFYTSIKKELERRNPGTVLKPEKEITNTNPGIRFNANKRPILNIVPLQKLTNKTEPKDLIGLRPINYENASRLREETLANPENEAKEIQDGRNRLAEGNASIMHDIPSESTTPSVSQVLEEPGVWSPPDLTTTFSPPKVEGGFMPIIPDNTTPTPTPVEMENIEDFFKGNFSTSVRKPRGPTKEGEYEIPSITTTAEPKPEEIFKGYQTIIEETTPGPKVIWYNHNQTPEDTFYPNFDNFLVPPEEVSVDMITTDIDDAIMNHAASKQETSFTSSEIMESNKARKPFKKSIFGGFDGSSSVQKKKKSKDRIKYQVRATQKGRRVNKNFPLQPAETVVEHGGVSYYYDDRHHNFQKSKESRVKHANRYHHESKQRNYGTVSFDNTELNDDGKEEVIIIPAGGYQHEEKTYGSSDDDDDDSVKYVVVNEYDDHFHDTHSPPPPPPITSVGYKYKNEISPYTRYRPVSGTPQSQNYYRETFKRPSSGGANTINLSGDYREGYAGGDSDYQRQPYDGVADRPKGGAVGGWGPHPPGPAGNYHGHKDGKDSNGFFSKAKEYFKNSDFSTVEKWFDVSIGVLAFLAFGGYIIMLLYQVFAVSYGRPIGALIGKSLNDAGEIFDIFFSKGPLGKMYIDELEFIVKRAMTNVKSMWMTSNFTKKKLPPKLKGEPGDVGTK